MTRSFLEFGAIPEDSCDNCDCEEPNEECMSNQRIIDLINKDTKNIKI